MGSGLRAFFAEVERSRGTGPRATVINKILTRSGAGTPELRSLGHAGDRNMAGETRSHAPLLHAAFLGQGLRGLAGK